MKKLIFVILFCCSFVSLSFAETQRLTIGLNWFPEVEHGGLFAANEAGFFSQESNGEVSITLLPGGPDMPLMAQLAAGKIDFAVMNADDVILAREQGIPLVTVAGGINQSPLCLMVHAESKVQRYDDLSHVKLALSPKGPFTLYLKKKYPLAGVTMVPYSGSVAPFLIDKELVSQAYVFSEPLIAESKGFKTRCLLSGAAGFNPYTSILVTTEKMLRDSPAVVKFVAKATQRGWAHYAMYPDAAHQAIAKVNQSMTIDLLTKAFEKLKPLLSSKGQMPAQMTLDRWRELIIQLKSIGLIKKDLEPEAFVQIQ